MLVAVGNGDEQAADQLLPLIYDELRALAAQRMAREPHGHTLQPTALVHEAYLRLVGGEPVAWSGRAQFFAAAAEAMRRILVERARRRGRIRHGGARKRVPLSVADILTDKHCVDLLAINEALQRMEKEDERMSRIVMLRFFAGLSVEDTAMALAISPRTVKRDWSYARVWLYQQLYNGEP